MEAKGLREIVYRDIPTTAGRKLRGLRRTSEANQGRWGADRLMTAYRQWRQQASDEAIQAMESVAGMAPFVTTAGR